MTSCMSQSIDRSILVEGVSSGVGATPPPQCTMRWMEGPFGPTTKMAFPPCSTRAAPGTLTRGMQTPPFHATSGITDTYLTRRQPVGARGQWPAAAGAT